MCIVVLFLGIDLGQIIQQSGITPSDGGVQYLIEPAPDDSTEEQGDMLTTEALSLLNQAEGEMALLGGETIGAGTNSNPIGALADVAIQLQGAAASTTLSPDKESSVEGSDSLSSMPLGGQVVQVVTLEGHPASLSTGTDAGQGMTKPLVGRHVKSEGDTPQTNSSTVTAATTLHEGELKLLLSQPGLVQLMNGETIRTTTDTSDGSTNCKKVLVIQAAPEDSDSSTSALPVSVSVEPTSGHNGVEHSSNIPSQSVFTIPVGYILAQPSDVIQQTVLPSSTPELTISHIKTETVQTNVHDETAE